MKKQTAIILFLLTGFIRPQAQTNIPSGDVYGDWKIEGSPYLIQGDIHIPSDERLTIRPGVMVVFQGSFSFEIEGKIEAAGTVNDSIYFTLEDAEGFIQGSTTGWNGLSFSGYNYTFSENSVLKYCNIEYSEFNGLTCMSYPYLLIQNSDLRYNRNAGLALFEFSDIEVEEVYIHDNNTGGIVSVYSAPFFSNFIIKENRGSGITLYGISSSGSFATFIDGKIINNATTFNGGGVYLGSDSYISVENVEIINNSAVNGGGIYCGMAFGQFSNVTVLHNEAENGGGLYCDNGANLTFGYCLIARNSAANSGGGAIIMDGSLNLENCTLSGNSAETGGGLYYSLSYPVQNHINNSIIWDNQPDEIGYTAGMPQINYSDIKGGFSGNGNFNSDPLFVDPALSDYHLTWTSYPDENGMKSPCIDSGNPDMIPDPDGTTCDVGAFYYDQGVYTLVNDNQLIKELLVYPNPAQNYISISSTTQSDHVKVISVSGETVIDQVTTGDLQTVDISFLSRGIYIVKLLHGQNVVGINKVIKN
jgi:predicted outer membrane repeat protein